MQQRIRVCASGRQVAERCEENASDGRDGVSMAPLVFSWAFGMQNGAIKLWSKGGIKAEQMEDKSRKARREGWMREEVQRWWWWWMMMRDRLKERQSGKRHYGKVMGTVSLLKSVLIGGFYSRLACFCKCRMVEMSSCLALWNWKTEPGGRGDRSQFIHSDSLCFWLYSWICSFIPGNRK